MAKGQKELPTLERKKIKEIEDAAEAFEEASDKVKEANKVKKEAAELLIARMRHHKLYAYRFDERIVTLDPKAAIKVKKVEDEFGESDDAT